MFYLRLIERVGDVVLLSVDFFRVGVGENCFDCYGYCWGVFGCYCGV